MPTETTSLAHGDEEATGASSSDFFLYMETSEVLASQWKSVVTFACFNIVTGILCVAFPVIATQAVRLLLISLVLIVAFSHVYVALILTSDSSTTSSATGSEGQRAHGRNHHLWVGLILFLVAFVMVLYPVLTVSFITFLIAIVFMVMGGAQFAIAKQNRQLAGRVMHFISGCLAVVASLVILIAMPVTQWITIGVLLGVNLINIGVARLMLGLYGRSIANSPQREETGWYTFMETDML